MKFHGAIGFAIYEETSPGIYDEAIVEKDYPCDIIRKSSKYSAAQGINDNLTLNMQISVIVNPFLAQNFPQAKYVVYGGTKWKITSIEDDDSGRPRKILNIGEVYADE
jgi:hypothetical protein